MAGTDLQVFPVFKYQMPDERREFHKIRPASHTLLSVNCLYQMNTAERKGLFYEVEAGEEINAVEVGRVQSFGSFFRNRDKHRSFAILQNCRAYNSQAKA